MVGLNAIAVWTVAIDTIPNALWPRLVELLDAAERERAKRFLFERDRRQYQVAHALKRLMLSTYTGGTVRPEVWTFELGTHGKPRVAQEAGPRFNLSHTDGLVVCAVSERTEVGVDVENLDQHAPLDLSATYFAAPEQRWLRSLPPAAQRLGFFRLWTLKEAYIKATGMGLAQPLDAFAFGLDPLGVTFFDRTLGDPSAWRFRQYEVGERHVLSVAWRQGATEMPVAVRAVRLETLLDAIGVAFGA
jgi:4'-phosphopantetheinyl transferase